MGDTKYKFVHIAATSSVSHISIFGDILLKGSISVVCEDGFFSNEIITLRRFGIRLNQN